MERALSDAAANLTADLIALTVAGLSFDGSVAEVTVDLSRPVGAVTIRIHDRAQRAPGPPGASETV